MKIPFTTSRPRTVAPGHRQKSLGMTEHRVDTEHLKRVLDTRRNLNTGETFYVTQ